MTADNGRSSSRQHRPSPRRQRAVRWRRLLSAAAVCGLATSAIADRVAAQQVNVPTTLIGSGTASLLGELTQWQDAMAAAPAPVDLQYFAVGTMDGRAKFLRGESDFVVSGTGFTTEELNGQPSGSAQILTVPLSVNAPAVVMTHRATTTDTITFTCDPDDPAVVDPEACIQRGTFGGPFRLPAENFAAFALNLQPEFEANGLRSWAHPSVVTALGTKSMQMQQLPYRYHTFVNRTEGEAENYFLQDYLQVMAPTAWALKQRETATSGWAWEPLREILPPRWVASRFGLDTVIGLVSLSEFNAEGGPAPDRWVGNMTLIPSTMLAQIRADRPGVVYDVVQLQNANGDWTDPSPAAVNASLAASTSPNASARQAIPGGYPLVWINSLSVRATGLSPAKAGALAGWIRYVVTSGQELLVAHGGVALPAAEVAQALAGADQLVAANCPAPGYVVTSGPRGPFEPDLPGLSSLSAMKHCEVAPPETSTTVATTTTTTTTVDVTPTTVYKAPAPVLRPPAPVTFPATPSDVAAETVPGTVVSADAVAAVEATTIAPGPPASGPPAPGVVLAYEDPPAPDSYLDNLPLPNPSDGRGGFRRLGTFLLGGGGFLLVRRTRSVWGWLLAR